MHYVVKNQETGKELWRSLSFDLALIRASYIVRETTTIRPKPIVYGEAVAVYGDGQYLFSIICNSDPLLGQD